MEGHWHHIITPRKWYAPLAKGSPYVTPVTREQYGSMSLNHEQFLRMEQGWWTGRTSYRAFMGKKKQLLSQKWGSSLGVWKVVSVLCPLAFLKCLSWRRRQLKKAGNTTHLLASAGRIRWRAEGHSVGDCWPQPRAPSFSFLLLLLLQTWWQALCSPHLAPQPYSFALLLGE